MSGMLRWSMNLFRIRGIQLAVHASFFLLLAYVGWVGAEAGGVTGALACVGLALTFFCCVVLHELGHCLVARINGIGVSRILLLPIGGMAEFEEIPRRPRTEILIALAGPAVNCLLVALLAWPVTFPQDWELMLTPLQPAGFLRLVFLANVMMGLFNLLPVFPMDGGRVLRALLATRLPYLRATFFAATIGKVLAVLLALGALWMEAYLLGVLFSFIFVVGEMEYRALKRAEADAAHWRTIWPRRGEPPLLPVTPPPEPPLEGER